MQLSKSGDKFLGIHPSMASRHGLVTGATGSGKTVSIKVLAEAFSDIGVPVFMQDVKGDLTGFITPGHGSEKFLKHLAKFGGEEPEYKTFPTIFWDIFAEKGHPLRTTVSEMGPMMMSQLLKLNETQASVVYTIFRIADDKGWLLLDLKDFIALIDHVTIERDTYQNDYGSIAPQSIGAIKRKLLMLESDGLDLLFGEPALNIKDLMCIDEQGKGIISVLNAEKISQSPSTYASFLLWLLSELFEELEEVGDVDKPKLIFFFDEAHMIFNNMPNFLLEKVEQVIKLIRSKGVGIYFITQNPADIPDAVLAQLGNRIQHVLRAYTPKEKKAVKVAADSFRANPAFKTEEVITSLGVGEALVSYLDEKGIPSVVERAWMLPPKSAIGPCETADFKSVFKRDKIGSHYDVLVDRESAYEILKNRAEKIEKEKQAILKEKSMVDNKKQKVKKAKRQRRTDSPLDKMFKSAASVVGSQLGRQIVRGILGSFVKK